MRRVKDLIPDNSTIIELKAPGSTPAAWEWKKITIAELKAPGSTPAAWELKRSNLSSTTPGRPKKNE
nr:hypothetical protein Iba_chr12bCG13930 [Ipomoea batatas]GMD70428.1 hypothetical protein Iba_chr12eCG6190 [Ipomoea batatas]GMD72448.1 hypothetical protein Iba_chr12fCG8700 [Ipomoea batatas]